VTTKRIQQQQKERQYVPATEKKPIRQLDIASQFARLQSRFYSLCRNADQQFFGVCEADSYTCTQTDIHTETEVILTFKNNHHDIRLQKLRQNTQKRNKKFWEELIA
jgi:hypothetical protein